MELRTSKRVDADASGVLVFEMNRAQLSGMLDEVKRIETVIARCGGSRGDDDV